jgi:hypothetical protein
MHSQSFQDAESVSQSCARLRRRLAGDNPVVCVSRELVTLAPHLLIKWRQKYVTEQGRDHSSYTKGNFEFERVVTGWRGMYSLLDLRLKR